MKSSCAILPGKPQPATVPMTKPPRSLLGFKLKPWGDCLTVADLASNLNIYFERRRAFARTFRR